MWSVVETIGNRLKRLRLAKGWTQESLASLAGMSAPGIINIERGYNQPRVTTILRLAEALQVPPAVLNDGIDMRLEPTAQLETELREVFETVTEINRLSQQLMDRMSSLGNATDRFFEDAQ